MQLGFPHTLTPRAELAPSELTVTLQQLAPEWRDALRPGRPVPGPPATTNSARATLATPGSPALARGCAPCCTMSRTPRRRPRSRSPEPGAPERRQAARRRRRARCHRRAAAPAAPAIRGSHELVHRVALCTRGAARED